MKRAYITGCDANHTDIAKWFVEQFEAKCGTEIPLEVYDFGGLRMSDHSVLTNWTDSEAGGWFLKPMAIEHALRHYDQVIWVDTDIQIYEDLAPLFEMIEKDKFLMAKDWYRNFTGSRDMYNSGITGVHRGNSFLNDWIASCQRMDRRGDQECLYALAHRHGWKCFTEMPQEYHYQRLMKGTVPLPANIKAFHHTGPAGKSYIRECLIADRADR